MPVFLSCLFFFFFLLSRHRRASLMLITIVCIVPHTLAPSGPRTTTTFLPITELPRAT